MEAESTQPVEVPINPFAQDEPTETAFPTPAGGAPHISAGSLTRTQPMRAMSDEHLETARHTMGRADTFPPKVEAKPITKPEADAKPDEAKPADAPVIDAAPVEIATADTGRTTLPVAAKPDEIKPADKPADDKS
jgi:hypothetical protein